MAAAVSLVAACGGSESNSGEGSAAAAQAFTYSGSDRDAYLAKCAADEGSLTWYTSLAGDVVDGMVRTFSEKHPNVKVETYRGEQTDIVSRVYQEAPQNDSRSRMIRAAFWVSVIAPRTYRSHTTLTSFRRPPSHVRSRIYSTPPSRAISR
jgi:ABC-type glycerol-3-phosphate transport system substrate-binding protein